MSQRESVCLYGKKRAHLWATCSRIYTGRTAVLHFCFRSEIEEKFVKINLTDDSLLLMFCYSKSITEHHACNFPFSHLLSTLPRPRHFALNILCSHHTCEACDVVVSLVNKSVVADATLQQKMAMLGRMKEIKKQAFGRHQSPLPPPQPNYLFCWAVVI